MHKLLQRLVLDHKRLLALLTVLECQLRDFHAGKEHDLDLVCELLQYVRSYEDQVHHPAEEFIFARFKKITDNKKSDNRKSNDEKLHIETLEHQHQLLKEMARKFHGAMESIIQGAVISREDVDLQGQALLNMLREHVELEEQEVFPYIDAKLDATVWASVETEIPKIDDPVFERPDQIRFRNLLKHLRLPKY